MNTVQQLLTDHLDIWTAADTEKKSGRGRSSANAASVYGIRKLRELILELAVRGKLVPQDANDEPASELLKRIQAEKARLIAEGKIRKDKPLPEIKLEEKPFVLPSGWQWVRFSDYAQDIATGPFGSMIHQSDYVQGGVPLINPSHMIGDKIISDESVSVSKVMAKTLDSYAIHEGDIVMARRGEVGRIALVTKNENGWLCGTGSFVLRFDTEVCRDYLRMFFRCGYARAYLAGEAVGTTMVNLNHGILKKIPMALPPLAEQHRIVAKVDELMALCDQLETRHNNAAEAHEKLVIHLLGTLTLSQNAADFSANWQRIAAHFDTLFTTEASMAALKQTLLQLAVMGKLVPQDPNDEPASELLKRIQAEKTRLVAEGKIRKDKPLPPITEDEKPFSLPQGWGWVRIENCCDVQGGIQKTPLRFPKNNHFPYLRVANVQRNSITVDVLERYELFNNELDQWRLKEGDLLVVEGNGSENEIGRCAIWHGQVEDCVYQNHLMRVRPQVLEFVEFLQLFLNSPTGSLEMRRLAITTSGLFNLSVGKIRNIVVAFPPLAEQHRIVAKVDELMALCDQLKSRITAASQLQQKLAEVMVEQAVA